MNFSQPHKTHSYFKYRWQLLGLIFALLFTGQILAQLELKKHTINSGGSVMTGNGFELKSSVAQIDANNSANGDDYVLNGGYWQQNNDLIFKNNF